MATDRGSSEMELAGGSSSPPKLGGVPRRGEGVCPIEAYENLQYVDLSPGLVDERGELIESLFSDGLHPNARGYEVVARNLERYVKE